MKFIITTFVGIVFGFVFGVSLPSFSCIKLKFPSSILSPIDISRLANHNLDLESSPSLHDSTVLNNNSGQKGPCNLNDTKAKIWAPQNPRGAEMLASGIVAAKSDLFPRRLWGDPGKDLPIKPKYLVTFTVGYGQKKNINTVIKKFSKNFTILLFHYDGRTAEWDEFEWSKRAIHVSVMKQTKWWYAKRFLHPDIVAPYDYIFIWDEDLGVEHFNAEKYISLVRKHGLEISQPALENKGLTWQMTKRRGDREVHKVTEEKPGWCGDPHLPPCAAFVEIMAPVFSRDAWHCVWYMIQNDLVHGWGLDFALRRCVEVQATPVCFIWFVFVSPLLFIVFGKQPAHEKIGVVDAQWIVHQGVPSLGKQGKEQNGKPAWHGVRERCNKEWTTFQSRMASAEVSHYHARGVHTPNSTFHCVEFQITGPAHVQFNIYACVVRVVDGSLSGPAVIGS